MRRFFKTLSFVMSAVVLLAAVSLIPAEKADALSPSANPAYYTNPHNIEWEGERTVNGCVTVYKDGTPLNIWSKEYTLGMKTADGTVPTAEELDLPEEMNVTTSYGYVSENEFANCFITVKNEDEIAQLCNMSEKWIEDGTVEKTSVKILYCYGCISNYSVSVTLKNADENFDPNSVSGLENVTFEQEYTKDNITFSYRIPEIEFSELNGISDILKADERVESSYLSYSMCEVCHTIFNEVSTDEYLECYYITDEPSISDDENTTEPATEPVTTAPEQTAVTTTTTTTIPVISEVITQFTTSYLYAGIDFNNVGSASADDIVIEPGGTAEMKIHIADIINYERNEEYYVNMQLPDGINCEKITYGNNNSVDFTVSGSEVGFKSLKNTVTITLSADEDISAGEYQIEFGHISKRFCYPFNRNSNGVYVVGGNIYEVSGGAVKVASPAVTTSVPETTVTTASETTRTTTTSREIYTVTSIPQFPPTPVSAVASTTTTTTTTTAATLVISEVVTNVSVTSLPPGPCPWIPGTDIARKVYVDNVVLNIGETAEMKFSVPDRGTIDGDYHITAYLPAGVYCENIIDCETELNIKFSMKTDEENNSVSFFMPSDEIIMTISAEDGSVPGTYSTRFSSSAGYSNPYGDYYHIFGNILLNFSGGKIEITDPESPAVTTTVIPVTQPENTETQPVTTTVIPVTSVISIDDLYPPYTRSTDIVRNACADDVVLRNGESAEMKLSVPNREESDGNCSVTVNLPFGVYCNSVVNSEDGEYIPFHMETSSEETVVSFSSSSDEVVMTLSVGGEIAPGTYQAIFKAKGLYTIDVTSGETYAYLYGNYEYVFSGGTIEITNSETSDETHLKGDISGNGEIDIYDAVEIAKEIIGMRTFTEEEKEIADINGDGAVNLYDAIYIAKIFI